MASHKRGAGKKEPKFPSRKKCRKQERAAKKERKVLYHSRQNKALLEEQASKKPPTFLTSAVQAAQEEDHKSSKESKLDKVTSEKNVWSSRASEKEKKEISKLEKLLKIDKRKKQLPKSFQEDGLDYILDLTDNASSEWKLSEEEGDSDSDKDQDYQMGESGSEPEEVPYASGSHRGALAAAPLAAGSLKRAVPTAPMAGAGDREVEGILKRKARGVPRPAKKRVCFSLETLQEEDSDISDGGVSREEKDGKKVAVEIKIRKKRGDDVDFQELDESYFETESIESEEEEEKEVEGEEEEEDEDEEEDDEEEDGGSEVEEDDEEKKEEEEDGEEEKREEDGEEEEEEEKEEDGEEKEEKEEDGEEEEEKKEDDEEEEEEKKDTEDDSEESETDDDDDMEEALTGIRGDLAADAAVNIAPHSAYVPPQLREGGKTERLRRRVQGLLNRLSGSSMKSISTQLEQLYQENSRNDMNDTLWDVLSKGCVCPVLISNKFSMEQTMLVAILHHHVGTEVGAHIVQNLAVRLDSLLSAGEEEGGKKGKETECLVLLLAHLYNYRVIHCLLIYDIIRRLVESFMERDVELLLLLLKNAGMEIRRDDPKSLKEIILQIQSKAVDSALSKTSRVKFMLETISALRTNNARKIPNYDPSLIEHMKKFLRGLLRTSGSLDEAQLKVSLQDLLNAEQQGRWWVVGSAWTGRDTNASRTVGVAAGVGVGSESWVMELARKQRMNTDIRKAVFSVLMTSEDYADAFQKLMRLGLKDVQEREIVHVLVDCCLQEKHYNPYYAYLAQKLCEFKKANQVTFQYSLWDRFKSLESLTPSNLVNLRQLCLHLVTNKALSLSVLKSVDFAEMDKCGIKFFKHLLHSLLTEPSEGVVRGVFTRIAPLPHLKKLRDSLLVFIRHFVATSRTEGTLNESAISQRITMVEHTLRAEQQLF